MRLIDADELIETLNKDIESIKDKPDSLAKEIAIKAAEFFIQDIQDVNTTPTAYNIDKVVEKLKDCEREVSYMDEYSSGFNSMLYNAIEIVKAGVRNEKR